MYTTTKDFQFSPSFQNQNQQIDTNENHYTGGVGIAEKMREYVKNEKQKAGSSSLDSVEKHEYTQYNNKVIPFSLYFENPDKMRLIKGGEIHEDNPQVMPEEMYNKLFFSVANEIDSNGNDMTNQPGKKRRRTRKMKK
jgi:hypothetical protein